jgi:hypothetical protein
MELKYDSYAISHLWFYCSCTLLLALLLNQFYFVKKTDFSTIHSSYLSLKEANDYSLRYYNQSINNEIETKLKLKPTLKYSMLEGLNSFNKSVNAFYTKIEYYQKAITVAALIKDKEAINNLDVLNELIEHSSDGKFYHKREYYIIDDTIKSILKNTYWADYVMSEYHYQDSIELLINDFKDSLLNNYSSTFKNCQKEMKVRDRDIEENIENLNHLIEKYFLITHKAPTTNQFKKLSYISYLSKFEQLKFDARKVHNNMISNLNSHIRSYDYHRRRLIRPNIQAKKNCVQKGEKFMAEVSVVQVYNEFPKTTKIAINRKKIELNAEGRRRFIEKAKESGTQTLKIEAAVKNPFTGENMRGNTVFQYKVFD